MSESIPGYDAWKLRSPEDERDYIYNEDEDEIEGDLDEIRADLYEEDVDG